MRHTILRLVAIGAFATLVMLVSASAVAQKGALYVSAHIEPESAKKMDGAQHAFVYVYDATGMKVSSGKGSGAWLPGSEVPAEPGDYWVSVGTEESAADLRLYSVEAGRTTVVESGWVSVATLPLAEQPSVDCAQWTATLRAYVMGADGKPTLVARNSNARTDQYGTLQLHPGEYIIEFNRLSAVVTVESGKDYRIPTGYVGPTRASEAYLLEQRDDDPKRKGLPICSDDAMHVLAGDYFVWEMVTRDDGATMDHVVQKKTVEKEGNFGYTSLKSDRPIKAKSRSGSDGQRISTDQIKGLSNWGKKKGEFDDLNMFSDPR